MASKGMESPLSKTARRLRESRSKSLLNIECFDILCTPEGMQQFLKQKLPMPHHSQLHGGKFELLSVDDDPINQMVLEGLLTPLGYKITPAMDGTEALEKIRSRKYLPDLVLLDVQMPCMTGYEVCERLRIDYPEGLPVIILSANGDEASVLRGLQAGSNDYIKKPFSRAELVARIETQIRLRDGWMAEIEAVRSNNLLGQVFPEHVAERLKNGESVVAEAHDCVTILFADIVGFTKMAALVKTGDLFEMLNRLYTEFDSLADKHGVHKVDTIGDAYMVAAGHEERNKHDHCQRMLAMAQDMLAAAHATVAPDGSRVRIRIGMHTGPAFAGVVGVKCPKYTFIGDTVNTASRMESNGFPMCIHVSEASRLLLQNVEWVDFGTREIKGKGGMTTFMAKLGEWRAAVAGTSRRRRSCTNAFEEDSAQQPFAQEPPTDVEEFPQQRHRRASLCCSDLSMSRSSRSPSNLRLSAGLQPDPVNPDSSASPVAEDGGCEGGVLPIAVSPRVALAAGRDLASAAGKASADAEARANMAADAEAIRDIKDSIHRLALLCGSFEVSQDPLSTATLLASWPPLQTLAADSNPPHGVSIKPHDAARRPWRESKGSSCQNGVWGHVETLRATADLVCGFERTATELLAQAKASRGAEAVVSQELQELRVQLRRTQDLVDLLRTDKEISGTSLASIASDEAHRGVTVEQLVLRLCSARGAGHCSRSEVDVLLGCLGFEHHAPALAREELFTVAALAQCSPDHLRAAGISSLGARTVILDAARGLRTLADATRANSRLKGS